MFRFLSCELFYIYIYIYTYLACFYLATPVTCLRYNYPHIGLAIWELLFLWLLIMLNVLNLFFNIYCSAKCFMLFYFIFPARKWAAKMSQKRGKLFGEQHTKASKIYCFIKQLYNSSVSSISCFDDIKAQWSAYVTPDKSEHVLYFCEHHFCVYFFLRIKFFNI